MSDNPYRAGLDGEGGEFSPRRRPLRFQWGNLLTIVAVLGLLVAFFIPARRSAPRAARRMQCQNNLKQIGLALMAYEQKYGRFPPAFTVDNNGRPLHSWRTLLLPFLEHESLYEWIDLSKPWNDPVNAKAFGEWPDVFRCPAALQLAAGSTLYQAVVAPGGFFDAAHARKPEEITRAPSSVLVLIEVPPSQAVHWMAPRDTNEAFVLSFGKQTTFAHLSGTNAVLADGSATFLANDTDIATRKAMLTIAEDHQVNE